MNFLCDHSVLTERTTISSIFSVTGVTGGLGAVEASIHTSITITISAVAKGSSTLTYKLRVITFHSCSFSFYCWEGSAWHTADSLQSAHTQHTHTHTRIVCNQHSLSIWMPGKQSPIFTFLREIMALLNSPVLCVRHWLHVLEIFNCLKEKLTCLLCQWSPITGSSELVYWLSGMKPKEEDFASPPINPLGFLQVQLTGASRDPVTQTFVPSKCFLSPLPLRRSFIFAPFATLKSTGA